MKSYTYRKSLYESLFNYIDIKYLKKRHISKHLNNNSSLNVDLFFRREAGMPSTLKSHFVKEIEAKIYVLADTTYSYRIYPFTSLIRMKMFLIPKVAKGVLSENV